MKLMGDLNTYDNIIIFDDTFSYKDLVGYLATDKWIQYKLSRESKDQRRRELNLTSDMLTNTMNVSQKLKEMHISM